jgi:hypothetical protein
LEALKAGVRTRMRRLRRRQSRLTQRRQHRTKSDASGKRLQSIATFRINEGLTSWPLSPIYLLLWRDIGARQSDDGCKAQGRFGRGRSAASQCGGRTRSTHGSRLASARPQRRRCRGGDVNAAPQSAKVARANSALRDLRRADQSREGASPSWHIPYTA